MLFIKSNAEVNGLKTEMLLALIIADQVYTKYDRECVLTEGTGGKHGFGSLHYVGYAIDLRTRDMSEETAKMVTAQIKKALGAQYDVVLESNHIHIEFQPK